MNAKQRNQLMRTIKTLNAVERLARSIAIVIPGAAKIADDVAAANRNVATVRNAHKPAAR